MAGTGFVAPTLAEIRRATPKQPGESTWAYEQRLGSILSSYLNRQAADPRQRPTESNWQWGGRTLIRDVAQAVPGLPKRLGDMFDPLAKTLEGGYRSYHNSVVNALSYAGDTPVKREQRATARAQRDQRQAARPAAPRTAWPHSFRDPAWDQMELQAAREFGVPVEALRALRTAGEKSNSDQVSSAGARSVYQIIPSTAAGIKKNYGFDPLSSPLNAARGAAAVFAEGLKRNKGNMEAAVREYHGGINRNAWGPINNDYASRVMGALGQAAGNFGAAPPGFNPAPFNEAESLVREAGNLLSQPTAISAFEAPRPTLEAPTPFKGPDYTASDAAFAKAAPTNPFADPRERVKIQKAGYFRGMAEALMSMNWSQGPGLGELFARLGAGALGGRLHGDDIIRSKQEAFDEDMRRYQLALANREDQKASQIANVANQNIQQMNLHNDKLFDQRLQEWSRNMPRVEGGNLITRRPDPQNQGNIITTVTPVGNAIQASTLMKVAEIRLGKGNAAADHDRMVWQAGREDARTGLAWVLQQGAGSTPEQQDQAALLEVADRVGALVESGRWIDTIKDPNMAAQLQAQAYMAAGFKPMPGVNPTKEQADIIQNFISSRLLEGAINGGPDALKQLYNNPAAQAAYVQQRAQNRRVSTRTDNRGRTSTTVSEAFR